MEILAGGLAASGACLFTNPLEVVKNRLQLQGELKARGNYAQTYRGPFHGLYVLARTDGILALQSGLVPACLYQLVMNGLRLGIYAELENKGCLTNKEGEVSLSRSLGCSVISGVIGGFVGSPIFLVKTQLQTSSSSQISVGTQHNHENMLSAFRTIYNDGGIRGLWQGASSSIPRISIGSAAQLVTYSYTQEKLDS
ncbi:solute carrier family 25 member 35 isoform X3 [Eurytemora carolleeae]|uniref:solute carrier family 25 member 35 isoform X3 n=1 Tax=Eurytemora carolleeae TaxID=1294199 RepID=UPI000C756A71|nr:solute carrier family 25 member 35 isoform X3 [Eurytemora carolleeae]|eukprot:XP_023331580.1 solute carrier family 25 member 35-like isoform X3 [Eurytemora affinis]